MSIDKGTRKTSGTASEGYLIVLRFIYCISATVRFMLPPCLIYYKSEVEHGLCVCTER